MIPSISTARPPDLPLPTGDSVPPPAAEQNRQVAATVRSLNEASAAGANREFSFALDPRTKIAVVRIVNTQTREVIEQVPSEYLLHVAQELGSLTQTPESAADKYFNDNE